MLELGQLIAGPFAAKTLADFGAEVIKVEPPAGGDPLRQWRLLKDGTSVWWQVQSRNKRSIALDLKDPAAQDIVRRLAAEADVLIENFRPGALEGWGLAPEALLERNPRLIVLRVSGYGQTGPYRDRPGFGVVAEAMGGLRHLTAEPGRVPVRVGVSIGDTLASLHGVIGILMALHERQASGRGQVVDVALYEAVFNCMESLLPEYSAFGVVRAARRQRDAGHRADQCLPLPRRRLCAGGRQRRQHLPAPDGGDRAARAGSRSAAGDQRRPGGPGGGDRRRDRRLGGAAHGRRSAGRAGGRPRAGRPHLHRGRHRGRPALPGAGDDPGRWNWPTAAASPCPASCPSCRARRAVTAAMRRRWGRTPMRC